MKNKVKKIAALTACVLSAATCLGAFAACKKDDGDGEKVTAVAAKAATCTGYGNIAFWIKGEKCYSDEACTKEIKPEETITQPLGHDYTNASYGHDAETHWLLCIRGCGEKDSEAEHVYVEGACVCGATEEEPPAPKPITLDKETLTLGIKNTEGQLTATTLNADAEVEWESDNTAVVLVGETGAVEALKPGAATVTAKIKGTEDTATCDILVEDAYYIIGGMDSAWNKCGVFGSEGVIYFMPTETDGIYKTESFELAKLGNFQVAPVGDTSGDWWKKAFGKDNISSAEDNILSVVSGNIGVEKHGMYTVTLDLTGEKAVVSGVCDKEIDDGETEDVYYIIGSANASTSWTTLTDAADAGSYAFTANGDGTYSLTVELTKNTEFKVAIVGLAWNGALGESAIPRALIGNTGTATTETDYQLTWTSSDNIGVGVTGWYTFTLNPEGGNNDKLSYTFSETNPNA